MSDRFRVGERVLGTRGVHAGATGTIHRVDGDGVPCVEFDSGNKCYVSDNRLERFEPWPPGSAYDQAVAAGKSDHDPVKAPSHYTRFAIQPLDFIMANKLDFVTGNVIKYVCRWDGKDGLQDLKKAREYLDRLIQKTENG